MMDDDTNTEIVRQVKAIQKKLTRILTLLEHPARAECEPVPFIDLSNIDLDKGALWIK